MESKLLYEEVKLEIVSLGSTDVITSSAFDGEEDSISEWSW